MTTEQLEERLAAVEQTVAGLQRRVSRLNQATKDNWLASVLGRFENDPDYAEVARLGREYRETGRVASDPPPDDPPK